MMALKEIDISIWLEWKLINDKTKNYELINKDKQK
jgi:hypothetical protein